MSTNDIGGNDRATVLREAFDRSFAQAPSAGAAAVDDLLAISLRGDRYALRLGELSGLFADKTVTWLPSPVAALLGIAGFRGTVLPVYDLGMLLGRPKAAAPRWLAVAKAAPLALAFDGFDGLLRARADDVVRDARPEPRGRHIREILHGDIARPIIHVASILETLVTGGGRGGLS
ncbi:MAG TPA: chemotaxis protein CheW [Vicinamibacterales bacterium]|nr:chemotaxis protein CheW [Vicinamibacterales bacterium]